MIQPIIVIYLLIKEKRLKKLIHGMIATRHHFKITQFLLVMLKEYVFGSKKKIFIKKNDYFNRINNLAQISMQFFKLLKTRIKQVSYFFLPLNCTMRKCCCNRNKTLHQQEIKKFIKKNSTFSKPKYCVKTTTKTKRFVFAYNLMHGSLFMNLFLNRSFF